MTATAEHVSQVSWSCPDATLILTADAPREQWLSERRNGIGGSDASTIAGVNAYSSRYELWLDKTGQLPDRPPTSKMRMGTKMEPVIAECFEEDMGIQIRRAGLMASKARPWQRVNVDRLTADGGILECKKTNWKLRDEWEDDQVADHAEIQVQHGLAVTGRAFAWVAVMIDGDAPEFRRVERDEELIATLTAMEEQFWTEHVLANVPPPIDSPAALDAVKARYPLSESKVIAGDGAAREAVMDWQLKKARAKAAEAEVKVAEAVVRDVIGDGEGLAVYGDVLATLKQNGAFNPTVFTERYPDLAESLTTVKTVLDIDAIKKSHPKLYTECRARVLRPVATKGK